MKKTIKRKTRSYLQSAAYAWIDPELFEIFFKDFKEVDSLPAPGEYRKVGAKMLVGLKPDSPQIRGTQIIFTGVKKETGS